MIIGSQPDQLLSQYQGVISVSKLSREGISTLDAFKLVEKHKAPDNTLPEK